AQGVIEHRIVDIDLAAFGGSALTDINIDVPHGVDAGNEIPITYVPARNTIFLSYALAWAEVLGSTDIFIGVNALDYSGYPDCRPEFIAAYEKMAHLATKAGVTGQEKLTLHTPLIDLTKAQIIQKGLDRGVDYGQTTSCYDPAPDGKACGTCDSCRLRLKGFGKIGIADPRMYQQKF
ncbi:MAG TPA: 7-cyano-7-deazaguanine synthase, partial [Tichowtungia sp.]|nr:7-cyano-7-deazaguanine synthase [Tichowtungia sp.]